MKSLMSLLHCMLDDMGMWCCASTTRDKITISRRVEHEGISFLTICLPTFCADFERSLAQGGVADNMFLGFKRHRGLPRFLGGFLQRVFTLDTGKLLDEPCKTSIFAIRQITLACKKIRLPCSEEREKGAYDGYVQCEKDVIDISSGLSESLLCDFDRAATELWARVLSIVDRKIYEGRHVPRHGPGTTAERVVANDKFNQRLWTDRLEEYFPSADFVIPNNGFFHELDEMTFLEPDAEMPVRVISVPKTLKTPRIIAIEPTCMQYAQQSILEILVPELEHDPVIGPCIGFTDQVPNQSLAKFGSQTERVATLDLSEASDRVSNLLVRRLLRNFPTLDGAVQACRSTKADVPGYGVIPLAKFASMGSALCFPIEAMVFLTICYIGMNRVLSLPVARLNSSGVRVYGDDIIVPTDCARSVCEALTDFGLKVNSRKSFWTGKFRESCGKDYYDGCDVTVTYIRDLLPDNLNNAPAIQSAVSLRNQLYKAGLWKSTGYLDKLIGRLAPFPIVTEESPVLGRNSFLVPYEVEKLHADYHSPLVRGMVLRMKERPSPLDGVGALMKYFLKRGSDPYFDAKHLERYGRPLHVDTKVRWASSV